MGSFKTIALAGVMAISAAGPFSMSQALAADLPALPPPPPIEPAPKVEIGSGWYLRGDVGIGILEDGKYSKSEVAAAGGRFVRSKADDQVFLGAGVGYRVNNWFRADVTAEYRTKANLSATDSLYNTFAGGPQTNSYSGHLSSQVVLLNGYFDLGTWNCLTPFIGAGVGFAHNTLSGFTDNGIVYSNFPVGPVSPTLGNYKSGDKTSFAWALMAGVGYQVNPNLTLELGYRYLNLGEGQTGRGYNAFTTQSGTGLKVKELSSHDIKLGMRWTFGVGDPECGACAQPVVAIAPPPLVRKY